VVKAAEDNPRGNNGCVFVSFLRGGNDDRGERTQQNTIEQHKRQDNRDEQDSLDEKKHHKSIWKQKG
jgi:hypothetical protein